MEEPRCPNCNIPKAEWWNNGQGFNRGGVLYCCRGCAERTGCTCHQSMGG